MKTYYWLYCFIGSLLFFSPLASYQREFFWSKVAVIYTFLFFSLCAITSDGYFNKKGRYRLKDEGRSPAFLVPLSILFIYIVASGLFIATNRFRSFSFGTVLFENFIFYILSISYLSDKKNYGILFSVLFAASFFISCYGILQYFNILPLPTEYYGENDPGATFNRTNQAVQFLLPLLPYFLTRSYILLIDRDCNLKIFTSYKRWAWIAGTAVIFSYFIVAKARGGYIGLISAAAFLYIVYYYIEGRKRGGAKINILAFLMIASAAAVCILLIFVKTSIPFLGSGKNESSVVVRIELIKSSVSMAADNIWFGVGIGNFETVIPKYQTHKLNIMKRNEGNRVGYAHDDLLQMLCEYGIVGMTLVVWILITILKMGARFINASADRRELLTNLSIAAGLIGLAVHSCVSYNFQFPMPLLCMTFLVSYMEISQEDREVDTVSKKYYLSGIYTGSILRNRVFTIGALSITFFSLIFAGKTALSEIAYAAGAQTRKALSAKLSLDYLNRAIDLNPYNSRAYMERGIAYMGLERFDEALKDFSKSLNLYPYDANTYRLIGKVYMKQGDRKTARRHFDTAVKIDPTLMSKIKEDISLYNE